MFYGQIEILKESGDKLSARNYIFGIRERHQEISVLFREYQELSRPSTRHKYRIQSKWGGWDTRDNTIKDPPHVPEGIKEQAIQRVKNSVKYSDD